MTGFNIRGSLGKACPQPSLARNGLTRIRHRAYRKASNNDFKANGHSGTHLTCRSQEDASCTDHEETIAVNKKRPLVTSFQQRLYHEVEVWRA